MGTTYSVFIAALTKSDTELDRKVLSDLAIHEPAAFAAIVEQARAALPEELRGRRAVPPAEPPAGPAA